jgi:hypothetical protein
VRQKIAEFIKHSPPSQSLWLRRLIFRFDRGLSTSEAEKLLRCNLMSLISDSTALEIPAAILCRIIGFSSWDGRQAECERLFTFCIEFDGTRLVRVTNLEDIGRHLIK